MPQMMPLNWLTLMLFFIIIFYFFNNLIFFNFSYTPKKEATKKSQIFLNWKW
uniref:ATP synthase complex subunit 8 n=1 Tax=Longitarsus membranaceus TaxID=346796 RepID=A0A3G1GRT5_9CUCU|nr:ATP synthase F0 subunit 8 [Longitarsus membranaceus]